MASKIQGITVEIGGDTTKLQTALKCVNGQIKSTRSQLKDVEKLLKLDPGNTELIAQSISYLARQSVRQASNLFKLIGKLNVVFHTSRAALSASILE